VQRAGVNKLSLGMSLKRNLGQAMVAQFTMNVADLLLIGYKCEFPEISLFGHLAGFSPLAS